MPVRQSYSDRVFTTSVVSYPELTHIGDDKDFTPVIEKALECGGYPEDHPMTGMNGGSTVMTALPAMRCCPTQSRSSGWSGRGRYATFS